MNLRHPLLAATVLAAFFFDPTASAQEKSKEVEVDIKNVSVQGQSTPDFTVNYTKPKRWRSKEWLELETVFEVKKARVPGENNPVVPALEFKFFVGLNKVNKDGKTLMLTGSASFLNAIEKSDNVAMMFVSPSSLVGLLEKNNFTIGDVKAWGVEVYHAGAVAGFKSSTGNRWWVDSAQNLDTRDGLLWPKAKTPFAPLWGDYDLESKQ